MLSPLFLSEKTGASWRSGLALGLNSGKTWNLLGYPIPGVELEWDGWRLHSPGIMEGILHGQNSAGPLWLHFKSPWAGCFQCSHSKTSLDGGIREYLNRCLPVLLICGLLHHCGNPVPVFYIVICLYFVCKALIEEHVFSIHKCVFTQCFLTTLGAAEACLEERKNDAQCSWISGIDYVFVN